MPDQLPTRERLLLAAVEVIDTSGVKQIRVRDIAARAGVKEPSVYHFFGSRDGLIEAAQAFRYNRGLLELTTVFSEKVRACSHREEFVEVIRAVTHAVFAEERHDIRAVRADVLGSAMSRPELKVAVASAQRESHLVLDGALQFAQERGWVVPDLNTMAFAVWYTGMVNGRLVYEIDPTQCSGAEWNKLATDVTISTLCGSGK
jgi:AcrR family transcriptional regulator